AGSLTTTGSKAGASAASFATSFPAFIVLIKLYVITITPVRYNAPPAARIMCIGRISNVVAKKFGYFNTPSGVNSFHIKPWTTAAQYIGIAYNKIPNVPIQKCAFASFFEYSGVL